MVALFKAGVTHGSLPSKPTALRYCPYGVRPPWLVELIVSVGNQYICKGSPLCQVPVNGRSAVIPLKTPLLANALRSQRNNSRSAPEMRELVVGPPNVTPLVLATKITSPLVGMAEPSAFFNTSASRVMVTAWRRNVATQRNRISPPAVRLTRLSVRRPKLLMKLPHNIQS